MKTQKIVTGLAALIAVLALVAAGAGVLTSIMGWPAGSHYTFMSLRGERVPIQGSGLYRFDSVSGAAQAIAQDVVTLLLGIPLLLGATVAATRGSLPGRVLQAGTLAYFLYTYLAAAMLSAYNELFLVYVALLAASLFAFVPAVVGLDAATLPAHVGAGFPRRLVGGFALLLGVLLALMWLGRIGSALLAGTPPFGLDAYSTLVIQVIDLGLIVPTALLTGVLVLRRAGLGYLLAPVVFVYGLTMGAALTAMVIGQILAGTDISPVEVVFFPTLMLVNAVLTVAVLRAFHTAPALPAPTQPRSMPPLSRPGAVRP